MYRGGITVIWLVGEADTGKADTEAIWQSMAKAEASSGQ